MGILLTVLVLLAACACFVNPVWALCIYLAVIIIRPNETVEGVKVPSIPLLIITMCVAYLVHLGKARQPAGEHGQRAPLLLVLMIALLVIHFILFPSGRSLLDWILSEAGPTLLLLFFFTRHATTPARLQATLTTTSASSAVLSLYALKVHFLDKGPLEEAESPDGHIYPGHGELWNLYHLRGLRLMGKEGSTWGNPNDMGMITNWAILSCLFYIKRKGHKVLRLAMVALSGLLAVSLFLTGSRGGLMQLGINLWMVFVGGKRKVLGIFLLAIAVVGVLVVLPRFSPDRSDEEASKDERIELLMAGFRLFKAYPVQGAGYLRFRELNDFKSLYPHNVYVQALAETGIVGAGIFFALIFFLRRETKHASAYFTEKLGTEDPTAALVGQVIAALQLSFSVFILFSNQFMTFRFGLVMTMAMALHRAMVLHREAAAAAGAGEEAPAAAEAGEPSEALQADEVPAAGHARRQWPRRAGAFEEDRRQEAFDDGQRHAALEAGQREEPVEVEPDAHPEQLPPRAPRRLPPKGGQED
jgi:O-antigen ligase